MLKGKRQIVVDWDGTLVDDVWPDRGEWLPGAVEALRELQEVAPVVISSCRTSLVGMDGLTPYDGMGEALWIRTMLDRAGLFDVEIHTGPHKPGGWAYIDDRAVRFEGDWVRTLAAVKEGLR